MITWSTYSNLLGFTSVNGAYWKKWKPGNTEHGNMAWLFTNPNYHRAVVIDVMKLQQRIESGEYTPDFKNNKTDINYEYKEETTTVES
jgi:hypothetical protein